MTENTGLVYVFTGDGKGKTSAALGTAVRAVGARLKVAWVAWYKQASWGISEHELTNYLPKENFEMHMLGKGFHIRESMEAGKHEGMEEKNIKTADVAGGAKVVDTASNLEHQLAAEAALEKALELLPEVDVLICDEINNAVDDSLLELDLVIKLLNKRGNTHIVLTGRNAKQKVVDAADLVSEIQKIKHPYDSGKLAVKGLDF